MKIIENTPSRLVMRKGPFEEIISGLIFALPLLAITYFLVGRFIDLHCEHASADQITCTLNTKLFGIIPLGQHEIDGIRGAEVEEHSDDDGSTYEIVLLTGDDRVSLTGYSSSGDNSKAQVAEQINQFIQTQRQNALDVQVTTDWWKSIFLLIFGGVGVGYVLTAKTVQIEMNRSEGVLRIQKDDIFGSSQSEFLLREVEDIYVWASNDSDGSTYRITFRIAGGEEIPLTRGSSSGYKSKQRVVELMKDFLSPYQRHKHKTPIHENRRSL